MTIRTYLQKMTGWIVCAELLLLPGSLRSEPGIPSRPFIGYEIVGRVLNPSPQQSLQYGYLNQVRGLGRISSSDETVSAANALLTFFNDTVTERVINNGTIRVVDRTGTGAIYFDSGNADFGNPDTFKKGTVVQSYTLRHQVVIDTSTGYFTTNFEITITAAKTFQVDGKTYRLGRKGGVYRLNVFGKLTPQAPPAAYIAGAAEDSGAELIEMN